jgi:ubiquinone/menaquinone biosynthesis C-methylase UbiE
VRLSRTEHGLVIHSAADYDRRLTAFSRGRERAFRAELIDLARIAAGDAVLDVGCGTGTLAVAARRRVGPAGTVYGIDPSPEMIARAKRKAHGAGLDIVFEHAIAQSLPLPDDTFDVALAVLTLHQIPADELPRCLEEVRRVLRPGGRLFVADLDMRGPPRGHTPHSHGHFDLDRIVASLDVFEEGSIEFRLSQFEPLRYVLATFSA